MVGGTSRRALLLGAPALMLTACGKAADEPAQDPNVDTGTQKQGDIDLLRDLLRAERAPGEAAQARTQRVSAALARQGQDHRDALQEAIRSLGGQPPAAAQGARDEPFDAAAVLDAAQRSVALYLDFVPKLSDARVRRLVAGILAEKAASVAQLRLLAGDPPVPKAFVG